MTCFCVLAAEADGGSGRLTSHAALRRLVRRLYVGVHAGVFPGVSLEEGLRRDRAEHLSTQPRVWHHVLMTAASPSAR